MRDKLHFSRRQIYLSLIILTLSIFSAQSTTGLLCLGILFLGFLLNREKSKLRRRLLIVVVLGVAFLYINYFVAGAESLLQKVIFDKMFNTSGSLDLNESTGYWRMNGLTLGWEIFLQHPLGAGDRYFELAGTTALEESSGAGLAYVLGTCGIITFLIFCYFHVYEAFVNIKAVVPLIVYLSLWIINGMANTEIMYACLLCIALVGVPSKKSKQQSLKQRTKRRINGYAAEENYWLYNRCV